MLHVNNAMMCGIKVLPLLQWIKGLMSGLQLIRSQRTMAHQLPSSHYCHTHLVGLRKCPVMSGQSLSAGDAHVSSVNPRDYCLEQGSSSCCRNHSEDDSTVEKAL